MELIHCTNVLLCEISMKVMRRNHIAITYALAIMSSEDTNWEKVNQAIIKRWSRSGLEYIKAEAWKLANKKIKEK